MNLKEYQNQKIVKKQMKGSVLLNKDEFVLGYRYESWQGVYLELKDLELEFHYLVDLNSGILHSIDDNGNPDSKSVFRIPQSMLHGKTKIVVLEERYLGLIAPNSRKVQILERSIIKGASTYGGSQPYFKTSYYSSIRLATPKDFEDFKVQMKGFDNEDKFIYRK
jgi:hypothetical protein